MGGVDDEPPSKRVKKESSAETGGILNKRNLRDSGSCSLSGSMDRPLDIEGDNAFVGTKGVIRKVELVRIIAEALYSLGYKKTGEHLVEESGIQLHSSVVNSFIQQVLDGNWDGSVATLCNIGLPDESMIKLASLVILEQKFFDFLDDEKFVDALNTLRSEIVPLSLNSDRVRELSSYVVTPSQRRLVGASGQDTPKLNSRSEVLVKLQRMFPPTVMILENRLVHLVEQALDLQRDACRFHNSGVAQMSLLTDHHCGSDQLPTHTLQVLQEHHDEVWFLQFSHSGKYLASASSDCTVIVWEVKADDQVLLKHRLIGHKRAVTFISWSPNDNQLLSCGVEEVVRLWDISSGECRHIYVKDGFGMVSCGWSPDGQRVFAGVTDRSITMWDMEGKELECWKEPHMVEISDLGIINNGKQIVAVCKDNTTLILFDWESRTNRVIEENQPIISFALSQDSKSLLVNLLDQEIHLWNIEGDIELVAKYKGHKHSRFLVRSCFGGLDQAFVASGSEDSQVYVWHRGTGELILTLAGHSGTVNCVSWNPVNPHMLASASDDCTIRIWGLNKMKVKVVGSSGLQSNDHQSNGSG